MQTSSRSVTAIVCPGEHVVVCSNAQTAAGDYRMLTGPFWQNDQSMSVGSGWRPGVVWLLRSTDPVDTLFDTKDNARRLLNKRVRRLYELTQLLFAQN